MRSCRERLVAARASSSTLLKACRRASLSELWQPSYSHQACRIRSSSGWRDMKNFVEDLGPPLWSHVAVPLRVGVAQFFHQRVNILGLDALQAFRQSANSVDLP